MRLYLDNDVDARCRPVIEEQGHECWTAAQAGRSDAPDDDQTVYAHEMNAVVVTHDREFTERRKRNSIWKHIRLSCDQPDGPDVLRRWLGQVVPILDHLDNVVIEIRPDGFSVYSAWA